MGATAHITKTNNHIVGATTRIVETKKNILGATTHIARTAPHYVWTRAHYVTIWEFGKVISGKFVGINKKVVPLHLKMRYCAHKVRAKNSPYRRNTSPEADKMGIGAG